MANPDKVDLKKDRGGGPKETVTEVWTLVRDYAKQETVDPLKGLLGFVRWGLIGAVMIGIGVIELMVAVLRVTQTETVIEQPTGITASGKPTGGNAVFDGWWSFVPYVITLVVATVVLLWTKKAISSRKSPTEPPA